MQRTFPQEASCRQTGRFVFINFYDYQIPDFIKDKDEEAYAEGVKGYGSGLAEIILKDPGWLCDRQTPSERIYGTVNAIPGVR